MHDNSIGRLCRNDESAHLTGLIAIFNALRAPSTERELDTSNPTIFRENRSVMRARYTKPSRVAR